MLRVGIARQTAPLVRALGKNCPAICAELVQFVTNR
jgi:hypothetical protein